MARTKHQTVYVVAAFSGFEHHSSLYAARRHFDRVLERADEMQTGADRRVYLFAVGVRAGPFGSPGLAAALAALFETIGYDYDRLPLLDRYPARARQGRPTVVAALD